MSAISENASIQVPYLVWGFMDVSTNVEQDMFDKYGLKAGDAVLQKKKLVLQKI